MHKTTETLGFCPYMTVMFYIVFKGCKPAKESVSLEQLQVPLDGYATDRQNFIPTGVWWAQSGHPHQKMRGQFRRVDPQPYLGLEIIVRLGADLFPGAKPNLVPK